MAIEYKPLVHETEPGFALPGADGVWSSLDTLRDDFIKNIKTRTIEENPDVGAIVSGIPSVFARTNLFRSAIGLGEGSENGAQNLLAYYSALLSEWKGFVACIALESQQLTVNRIYLEYSDHKKTHETSNLYEPKGAFGNMLFNRRKLWSEQESETEHLEVPFVDVIKYGKIVVGGTSPESLLFTSVAYKIKLNESKPFIDSTTGKFVDPLAPSVGHSKLDANQTAQLIAYVNHLITNLQKIDLYYKKLDDDLRPNYNKVVNILSNWRDKLLEYSKEKRYDSDASVPTVTCFKLAPFSTLFNHSDSLYGLNGIIFDFDKGNRSVEFRPKELLLSDENAEIARLFVPGIDQSNENLGEQLPAFYVKAVKKGNPDEFSFFALPLSPKGLAVFGDSIGQLLGYESGDGSRLNAEYDEDEGELYVDLSLKLSESDRAAIPVSVKYKVAAKSIKHKEIIIWPNFKAKNWNRYFVYSEIPHNVTTEEVPFISFPFVGQSDRSFSIIEDPDQNSELHEPLYLAKDGRTVVPANNRDGSNNDEEEGLNAKLHVVCPVDLNNPYKYEIYESNKPFKGVKLMTGTHKEAGFLVIRYMENVPERSAIAKNYSGTQQENTPKGVTLGIDFGSTNSSVAYRVDKEAPEDFILRNHRISLLPQRQSREAKENEILFFQAKDVKSNAIKSVITLHDARRLKHEQEETNDETILSREVKGGFPCVEPNLPVVSVGKNTISLNYPQTIRELTQINNMKWQNDSIGIAHMTAFLRSLILQICADLFTEKRDMPMVPEKVNWAYPAAMPIGMVTNYQNRVWNRLNEGFQIPVENAKLSVAASSTIDSGMSGGMSGGMGGMSGGMGGMSGGMGGMSGGMGGMSGGMGGMSGGMGGMSGGMGGMSGGMGGMSGSMSGMSGGMGGMSGSMSGLSGGMSGGMVDRTQTQPDLRPTTEPVKFNFQQLQSEGCLTEACAVANYVSTSKDYNVTDIRYVTLCFDIGGSTSDISALCQMKGMNIIKNSMVKQSSIRFAAQRVTNATSYSKSLKEVLLHVCSDYANQQSELYDLMNHINSTFSSETAPYFFEQIVNTLSDEQLPVLYKQIRSRCPELMVVNLYVTGLIMFYAGQLAHKLVSDLQENRDECGFDPRPYIDIVFAGKGSRIFEWFVTTDPQLSKEYYHSLFLAGMGGMEEASKVITDFRVNWPSVKKEKQSNVKYEVSKGLARIMERVGNEAESIEMMVPKNNASIELLGEDSFEVRYADEKYPLKHTDTITPTMLKYIGTYFTLSRDYDRNPCPCFWQFMNIFGYCVLNYLQFKTTPEELQKQCEQISITSFIKDLPDFKEASAKGDKFDFVAPIFILEGMKFYEDTLLKIVQQRY